MVRMPKPCGGICAKNGIGNITYVSDDNTGRKLLRYNFFMLQADVLPNMGFSSTRKRLVYSHECVVAEEQDEASTGVEQEL